MANPAFTGTIEVTNGQTDRRVNKARVGGFMSTLFMMRHLFFKLFLVMLATLRSRIVDGKIKNLIRIILFLNCAHVQDCMSSILLHSMPSFAVT